MLANRKLPWLGLSLLAVTAVLAFAYPFYVIRPFRAQGERELAVALIVRAWGPPIAIAAAAAALLFAVHIWRTRPRWLPRLAAVSAALVTIVFAALSRVNVYEIMFHRVDSPAFQPATSAKLDPDDMVLAIRAAGIAHAYPIRTIAYHHIVNDRLGEVPVVATY